MGKLTISMAMFNSNMFNYQRVFKSTCAQIESTPFRAHIFFGVGNWGWIKMTSEIPEIRGSFLR